MRDVRFARGDSFKPLPGGGISRILSRVIIPLGPLLPAASCCLPESFPPGGAERREPRLPLLFGIAPDGVCRAGPVARNRGGLLPHRFTLTRREGGRFVFCGTFRRVAPPGCYPASRSVESGLSSNRPAPARDHLLPPGFL